MIQVDVGTTVTLHLGLEDNRPESAADNPIIGQTCVVSIRRLSDDRWYNFTSGNWDVAANYAALGANHKGSLTDKGDGGYERDWDQSSTDSSAYRIYQMVYVVTTGSGDFDNTFKHELWQFGSAIGQRTVNINVKDTVGTDVSGVAVRIMTASEGENIRPGLTTDSGGDVQTALDDGTYYVRCFINGYTHTETTFTVDESPEQVNLTLTGITIAGSVISGAKRVWAWPREIDGQLDTDTSPVLFTARVSKPALTANGIEVGREVDATRHTDGYWYVDVLPTDVLEPADGSSNLTYVWSLRTGRTLTKNVEASDPDTVNLISGLDG